MSSDEEEGGPPRKHIVKDARTPKAAPQTKPKFVLDLGSDSEDESISTKKMQESSSKNGPPKTKPRTSKVTKLAMTHEEPKKAAKPDKKEAQPKKMKGEEKKAEVKQKPE